MPIRVPPTLVVIDGDETMVHLTKGFVAYIDTQDVKLIVGHSWTALLGRNTVYAKAQIDGRHVSMHRFILGLGPQHLAVDHVDGNGLNNRRTNLRLATGSLNQANSRKRSGTSSIYKGVYWHKAAGRWQGYINNRGQRRHLGLFDDEREAALAYDAAAVELWGDFARLNLSRIG